MAGVALGLSIVAIIISLLCLSFFLLIDYRVADAPKKGSKPLIFTSFGKDTRIKPKTPGEKKNDLV